MRHIEVNGCILNVKIDVCTPDAPWIVFSNSLITDLSIWDAQVEMLKDQFNLLRYDQRGHGESAVSAGALNFEALSDDLIQLMDHFAIERAIYVGLSMGVPTGLAAYSQGRFEKMILIDGQTKSAVNASESWQQRIDSVVEFGMESFAKVTSERWLVDSTKKLILEKMMASTSIDGFIHAATALKHYDYSHVLKLVTCPVLLIAGAQDGNMPRTMREMATHIADATFIEIENAGHVPCFEQAGIVNQHIANFLRAKV